MKLVNSKNIKNIIEDSSDPGAFYNTVEDETRSPCWEVSIDRENEKVRFLINAKEIMTYPLSKINVASLTVENISKWITMFRTQNLKALRKMLKLYNFKGV